MLFNDLFPLKGAVQAQIRILRSLYRLIYSSLIFSFFISWASLTIRDQDSTVTSSLTKNISVLSETLLGPSIHDKGCQSMLTLNSCQLWWINQGCPGRFMKIVKRGNLFSNVIPTYEMKCAFSHFPSPTSRHSNHIKWALIIMAKKAGWLRTECRQRRYRMNTDGNWRSCFQLWKAECQFKDSNYV